MKAKDIEKIIEDWVTENYGPDEAQDPSWSIKDLAKHLSKKL